MTDEERDPSGVDADGDDDPDKRCEHCGASIATSEWYPVTSERDADGSIRLYEFCSEACQTAWFDARSN